MMSRMTPQDIDKLAELSRLSIDEAGKEAFGREIEAILGYVSEIKNLVDSGSEGHDEAPRNVLRDDDNPHASGAFTEELLNSAPHSKDGYITVKNIF